MSLRALSAALALGLGLASAAVGTAAPAQAAGVVRLALAVPITVPGTATGLIPADLLAEYTAPQGVLTRELDAVGGRPVALGIDPQIIASIRVLGTAAPASATAWLSRLSGLPNQTFPLGYADADVTLQTQGGSPLVLSPENFDFTLDAEAFATPTATPIPTPATPTPSATPDPVAALPTTEELLAWPYTVTGVAWPRDDTIVAADLPKIAASGYATTVASSNNLTRDATAGPLASAAGSNLLVSDEPVSTALRAAASAATQETWQAAVAQLSSSVSAAARVQPTGTAALFATMNRTLPLNTPRLADTIDALSSDPSVRLVTLSEVLGTAPSAGVLIDSPQDVTRLARAGQMIQGEAAERAFASVAADPTAITAERRLQLLGLLSNSWVLDDTTWPPLADAFTTASIALRNSVHLVESSNFLLVADNDQKLPITVRNGLDQPVTVYVTVTAESSLLAITDSRVKLEIEPGSQAKALVPVRSLSNGVVDVSVSLTSVSSAEIGAPIVAEINVQAGWETPVVVTIAILVVVVFGAGIVRTVLRRRHPAKDDGDE